MTSEFRIARHCVRRIPSIGKVESRNRIDLMNDFTVRWLAKCEAAKASLVLDCGTGLGISTATSGKNEIRGANPGQTVEFSRSPQKINHETRDTKIEQERSMRVRFVVDFHCFRESLIAT